jgi:hypothetical protein
MLRRFSCLALLSAALPLLAQTNFGRISGTVTDPSGAAVAGANVVVRNTDTQATRTEKTDERGTYVAENLPIGPYTVEVDHPGFKHSTRSGFELVADGRITADIALQMGESTQTVEVVAAPAEVLNTVSGEVSHVIDKEQVDNLALNGRNYMEMLTWVPGTIVTNPDTFSINTSLSATNQVVNGHRSNENSMTIDGLGNLDNGSNGSLINNLSPEFMQEVKIQTSNFSAEYGRSTGAAFALMTKNGTNRFHGGASEYFRNDALDARNFFAANNTELRYNDWGWNLGGPIKKDKLFFFAGEVWKKIRQQSAPSRYTVPDSADLTGNFSARKTVYYPGTKTPLPGNILPASLITPDGLAFAKIYATSVQQAAIYTDTPTSNNVTFENPNPLDYRQDMARVDYRINDRHTVFGRFVDDSNSIYLATGPGGDLPITPEIRSRPAKSALLSETWVITPTIVNEAHIGASWNSQHYLDQGNTWQRTTEGFQFQRIYNSFGPYTNGIPDASSVTTFATWDGPAKTLISPTAEIEMGDTVSIVRQRHNIRLGVMVIRNRKDQNGRSAYDGSLTFSTSAANTTGLTIADMLTGSFATYIEAAYDPMGHYRYTEPAAFVDDVWKVGRKLSIDLGLRYEYMMAMYSTVNNLAEFVPSLYNPAKAVTVNSSGNVVVGNGNIYNGLERVGSGINPAQAYLVPNANDPAVLAVPDGAPRGMYPSQGTWSPRVGFAYSPDAKTVIRGGYGLFYDRIQGNPTFYTLNNPPYVGSIEYQNGNLSNITGGAVVNAPWGTIQTIDPKLKIPYSQQFSIGIQREMPLGMLAQAYYVGTLSRRLLDEPDINQPSFAVLSTVSSSTNENSIRPYPGYSTIQQFESRATSNYHALQLFLTRRLRKVFFTTSYTFSKNLGDASSDTTNNYDAFNVRAFYGPVNFDVRHVLVGTAVLDLPQLRHSARFLREPLGSWQLSATVHFQTGFYYSVTGSSSIVSGRLADYVGGPAVLTDPGPNGWFNPKAYAVAPYTRWGTAGAGDVEGPGMQIYNLSLSKFFIVNETRNIRLRVRADFVNAFNCVNFQGPSTNISSSSFGTISSAYPARNIQLGIHLTF